MGECAGQQAVLPSVALISSIAYSVVNFRGPLIQAMVARKIRVYALAPDYDDHLKAAVRALGAEPVDMKMARTGLNPIRDIWDMFRLVRLLRRLGPDMTLAYFIKPVIYGSIAARLAGIPRRFALVAGLGYVFTEGSGGPSRKRRLLKRAVSALYRLAFSCCARVFFQNDDDITEFVDAGLLGRDKAVRLNGTGVDLAHFAPAPPVVGPLRFLLIARLLREKGIAEFVAAARIVRARAPDAQFVLLGGFDPNPGGFTPAEIALWDGEGDVHWQDHVDDVRPWIARSSVYVLPSYREGVPRSTQEAMAMARPIITTDAVGCRETVIDGENGYLVPVRDPVALADAMLRFVAHPALVSSMGQASRRLAEQRFDVHRVNDKILEILGVGAA